MTEPQKAEPLYPTMKASSSNTSKQGRDEEEDEEPTEHRRLQLQKRFKNLEVEWDSIKKSNPRSSKAMVRTVQYTNNSPRSLMSTLQCSNKKPISTTWKVRTNDVAVDDIMRERRAAIESGELKGRSLLEAFEGAICNELPTLMDQDPEEVRLVDYSDFDGYEVEVEDDKQYHVWEVKSTSSSSSPVCCCDCSSCLCSSVGCEGDRMSEEHKDIVDEIESSNSKGWWMAFKPWLATSLALLGLISAMAIFDYGDDKVFQVPT